MSFYLILFQFIYFFPFFLSSSLCSSQRRRSVAFASPSISLSPPLQRLLALSPLVTLLELPQPAAPQVLPRDEQASLVRHHAALPGGIVVRAQEQVLPPGLDLWAFTGHVLGAHPQQLVPTADAVLTLLVDGDDVDGELPPLARFVPF